MSSDEDVRMANDHLTTVCDYDPTVLVAGDEALESALPALRRARVICQQLKEIGLGGMPIRVRNKVAGAELANYRRLLDRIARKQLTPQNAAEIRNDVAATADMLFDNGAPVIAYYRLTEDVAEELRQRVDTEMKQVERRMAGFAADVQGAGRDAKDAIAAAQAGLAEQIEASKQANQANAELLENAKAALAIKLASHHSTLFAQQATADEIAAEKWLRFAMLGLAVTALAALLSGVTFTLELEDLLTLARNSNRDLRFWMAIGWGVTRFIVVSVFASTSLWMARLYRAHRHNHVVNKHRAQCLGTVEALVAAAGSRPGTSDIILQHAASAIFSPQPTGYGDGTDPPAVQPQLLEVVRTAKD